MTFQGQIRRFREIFQTNLRLRNTTSKDNSREGDTPPEGKSVGSPSLCLLFVECCNSTSFLHQLLSAQNNLSPLSNVVSLSPYLHLKKKILTEGLYLTISASNKLNVWYSHSY